MSQCWSITSTMMIIILGCNKTIRWAFSAGYTTAKTPDCHAVFSSGLLNCIFPPAKAVSDTWSEVQRNEEQWVCYQSTAGRRTANCSKLQLTAVVPTAGHIHIQIGSPSVCLNPMTCLCAILPLSLQVLNHSVGMHLTECSAHTHTLTHAHTHKGLNTYISVDLFLQILVDPLQRWVAALYSKRHNKQHCSLADDRLEMYM